MTEHLIKRYTKQLAQTIDSILALEKRMRKDRYESEYDREFESRLKKIDDLLHKRELLKAMKGRKVVSEKIRRIETLKKHLEKKQERRHSKARGNSVNGLKKRASKLKKELRKK